AQPEPGWTEGVTWLCSCRNQMILSGEAAWWQSFLSGFRQNALYTKSNPANLPTTTNSFMRVAVSLLAVAAAVVFTGCAGPENKFGRGLNNLSEIVRGGEMRRSIEQTGLWDGPSQAASFGFARGFTRTMARTGIGL